MRKLIVLMILLASVVTYSNAQEEKEGRIIKIERTGAAKKINAVKEEGESDIDFLNEHYDLDAVSVDDVIKVSPPIVEEEEEIEEEPVVAEDAYTPTDVAEKQAATPQARESAVASNTQRTATTRSSSSYKKSSKRKRSWNYGRVKKMKRKPRLGKKRRGCPTF